MPRPQRIELLLFIACFISFAWFNQGGGWNQNSRFAEVRAIVEEGRFPIDNFLVYRRGSEGRDLRRLPVTRAEYTHEGKPFRLSWVDNDWNLFPIGDHPMAEGTERSPMVEACASGDIGYVPHTGHFHPNKPPGTSFLAVPAYWVIHAVERGLGISPDSWWTLNFNAWLTTVCSVGILSALGCVLFYRLALKFADGGTGPALLATAAFAWGTTYFPFGTILFDHNLTAALLIAALYFLMRDRSPLGEERWPWAAAGICAGLAAITNYVAAVAVIFLGLYALLAARDRRAHWPRALWFSGGVLPLLLLICWYNWLCFGSPFRLANDFQNPLFAEPTGRLFGMFGIPNGYVAALLAISPFRGIFWFSPVLIAGVAGLIYWLVDGRWVAEVRLCLAMFVFFFFVNSCFNGYHAGFSAGPRYLVPGIPFLAFGIVRAAQWLPRITGGLAAVSIAVGLLLTATDAQNPVGVGGHTRVEGRRNEWTYNLLSEYAWPLFAHGRAWPLLEQQLGVHLESEEARLATETDEPDALTQNMRTVEEGLRAGIRRGEASPFLLGSVAGPVSVNPMGVFEGLFTYAFFPPGTPPTRWASWNLGEFLFPESRWSLAPLVLLVGGLMGWPARLGRKAG